MKERVNWKLKMVLEDDVENGNIFNTRNHTATKMLETKLSQVTVQQMYCDTETIIRSGNLF